MAHAEVRRPAVKTAGADAKPAKTAATTPRLDAKAARATAKTARVDGKSAKLEATPTKSQKLATAPAAATSSTATTTTATGGTVSPGTIDFTSGKTGSKLLKNTALRAKLESRLTALGYDGTVYQAAYGFRNLGQFVAATNVSRNLGIPFEQLKIQMTGLSVASDGTVLRASIGTDGKVTLVDPALGAEPAATHTLGQSIQAVKSNVDAISAAQTATMEADAEIARTSRVAAR